MQRIRLPKSIRKFIRRGKARIRREISVDAEERIKEFLLGIRQGYNKSKVEISASGGKNKK